MKLLLITSFVCLCLHIGFTQNEACPNTLQMTGQINSEEYKAAATLNSNGTILPNSEVVFKSGNTILLEQGFSTGENVTFLATIETCNSNELVTENTLVWSSFPTSVSEGATYTVELDYSLVQQGLIHLILADENWTKIGEAFTTNLAAGTGTESLTFTLTGTPSTSINYLQARLLNTSWEEIGVPNLTETIPADGGNTLENSISWDNINDLPDNIIAGASYNVAIDYSLTVPGLIYLQLMDADFTKVGEIWTNTLNVGSGTATLILPVNNNVTSTIFYIQAQLFDATWTSVGVNPIQEPIEGNSNCPEFGLSDANDPPLTEYRTAGTTPPNKNLQDAANSNTLYGYRSNWYVSDTWRGPIKAFWGYVSNTVGYNFWMEWENTQQPINGVIPHGELDVRVQKHIWSYDHDRFGYPKRIEFLPDNLNCTATGQWAPCSSGRGHINLTVWVSTDSTSNFDSDPTQERCDIIIHGWDNSGNMSVQEGWNIIGTPTSGGVTYDVLQRPGDLGEKASFNIVPHVNGLPMGHPDRMPIIGDYPDTDPMSFNIDVKFFIDWLMENAEGDDGNPIFDETWHLIGCEWTITPQSEGVVDGVTIPASKGRWTFMEYLIANLNSANNLANLASISRLKEERNLGVNTPITKLSETNRINDLTAQEQLKIYPSPFRDFISIIEKEPSSSSLSNFSTLLIFDITGRQVASVPLKDFEQQIPTNHLDNGLYFYQVYTDFGRMIANGKIVKH